MNYDNYKNYILASDNCKLNVVNTEIFLSDRNNKIVYQKYIESELKEMDPNFQKVVICDGCLYLGDNSSIY